MLLLPLFMAGLVAAAEVDARTSRGHELRNRLGLRAEPLPIGYRARLSWVLAQWPRVEWRLERMSRVILGDSFEEMDSPEARWFVDLIPWLGRALARDVDTLPETWLDAIRLHAALVFIQEHNPDPMPWPVRVAHAQRFVEAWKHNTKNPMGGGDPIPRWERIFGGHGLHSARPFPPPPLPVTLEGGGRLYTVHSGAGRTALTLSVVEPGAILNPDMGWAANVYTPGIEALKGGARLRGTFTTAAPVDTWRLFQDRISRDLRRRATRASARRFWLAAHSILWRAVREHTLDDAIEMSLPDIADWAAQADPPVDLSRYDWPQAFLAAAQWHASFVTAEVGSPVPLGKGDIVRMRWPDGWTLVEIHHKRSLENEGISMAHCVGGYWPAVRDGTSTIWSLREDQGVPRVTMEIENENAPGGKGLQRIVAQAKGAYDALVVDSAPLLRVRANEAVIRLLGSSRYRVSPTGISDLDAPRIAESPPVRLGVLDERVDQILGALRVAVDDVASSRPGAPKRYDALRRCRDELFALASVFAVVVPGRGLVRVPVFLRRQVSLGDDLEDVHRLVVEGLQTSIAFPGPWTKRLGEHATGLHLVASRRKEEFFPDGTERGDVLVMGGLGDSFGCARLKPGHAMEQFFQAANLWPSPEAWLDRHREDGADGVVTAPL